jgi:phage shock protein PspC (stress-responsive transcriptional regulator)
MEQNSSGPGGGFDRNQLQSVQSWRRSRSDRWVAGVCGGIGRALNIDPVLVRVVMAVLIISGPGVVFYLAAWLLMPDEGKDRSAAQNLLGDKVRPDHPWLWPIVIGACVFIAIAMMSSFDFGRFVPGPLIVLAVIWILASHRKGRRRGRFGHGHGHDWSGPGTQWSGQQDTTTYQGTAPQDPRPYQGTAPTPPMGQPTTSAYASSQTGPSTPPAGPSSSATQRPQDRTVEPVQPVWTEDDPLGLYVDEPPTAPPTTTGPDAEPPAKGMRGVKSIVVVLTGIAIAIAAAAGAATSTMLIIGLATLGAGMLLGGFVGRTLALLPLGILLAIGAVVSTVFPTIPRNFADFQYIAQPGELITATTTSTKQDFDAGSVQLDLTKAKFGEGAKVEVHGKVGEIVVRVPPNVDVTGNLSAKMGELIWMGEKHDGHRPKLTQTDLGADGKVGPETVTLDLELKFGSIRVERG